MTILTIPIGQGFESSPSIADLTAQKDGCEQLFAATDEANHAPNPQTSQTEEVKDILCAKKSW